MSNSKNKSSIYGYYGSVTGQQHYVPVVDEFTPLPPKMTYEELFQEMQISTQFVNQHKDSIVLRTKALSSENNVDTFIMNTLGDPNEIIKYTTSQDEAILSDAAGDGFSDTDGTDVNLVDGGLF